MCNLQHDEDGLPEFLCRVCHPELNTRITRKEDEAKSAFVTDPNAAKLIAANRLKKLKAEERRLSGLIDDIGGRDPARRKKLYDAIREVERDIAKLESA